MSPTDAAADTLTVSEALARRLTALTPEALPAATLDKSRDILVDVVGLCLGARGSDYVAAVKAAAEPGDHLVIGHAERVSPSSAALLNGTAAHGEDFDDTFEGGPVHAGAVIVPALIGAAQTHAIGNDRLMLGIAAGTETLCRLASSVPKAVHAAGFHPTAVLGAFAATAGVCVGCASDEETTVNALGIVGSMASGIIEYLGDGSWTKRMHPGWAAQSALRAHAMARAGFIGPRGVFEGKHGAFRAFAPSVEPRTERLLGDFGARYVMDTISFKPYPCGTMIQPYIDCARALKARGVAPEGVESILCRTAEGIVHRLWEPLELKRCPPTAYAAKFSVPFGVALGLVRGRAELADFTDEAIADPALLAVARKVSFEVDPDDPYPLAYTGHVLVRRADGRHEEAVQGHLRGGVTEPLARDEIDAKFRANARFGGFHGADGMLHACDRIAAMDPDRTLVRELGRS